MPARPSFRQLAVGNAVLVVAAVGCVAAAWAFSPEPPGEAKTAADLPPAGSPEAAKLETAIFAGGCFWCMEPPFDKLTGVKATTSGYTGGRTENPTYEEVSSGGTGHTEALKVTYDPAQVSYETLLEVFWRNHDPADRRRPVLRPRHPISGRDLLSNPGTEGRRRGQPRQVSSHG